MDKMSFKRGDTFSYYIELVDVSNVPVVVDLADIKSQIRAQNDVLIDDLTIETTATAGTYHIFSLDTSAYPVGKQYTDVKIMDGGVVVSTSTVELTIEKDVTRWL